MSQHAIDDSAHSVCVVVRYRLILELAVFVQAAIEITVMVRMAIRRVGPNHVDALIGKRRENLQAIAKVKIRIADPDWRHAGSLASCCGLRFR